MSKPTLGVIAQSLGRTGRAERIALATGLIGVAIQLSGWAVHGDIGNGRPLYTVLAVGIAAAVLSRKDVSARVAPLMRGLPRRARWVLIQSVFAAFAVLRFSIGTAAILIVAGLLLAVMFVFVAGQPQGQIPQTPVDQDVEL